MALVLADRVQQTGTANTTVSFTLSGSVAGFQSFAVVGNGNTTYYSAVDGSGNWEVGIGTYSTTGPTLTRTTILSSSNSGSAVTFSGTISIIITYPSSKSVNLDAFNIANVSQLALGTSTQNQQIGQGNASIMKNRIINGAMVIDQRNAGASVTPTSFQYTVDRWGFNISVASKFSLQQNAGSVTPPVGFVNYLGATSLSAYSVGTGDFFQIAQSVEGYNIADLGWGTANAKTVTVSFWVYSSLTGTFSGSLTNDTGAYSYVFNYSIPVASTWTQISVTLVGPTVGTWQKTNSGGIGLRFGLGCGSTYSTSTVGSWTAGNYIQSTGSVSVVGTNGATFYITGVQLEVGSSATGFEYRQYGQELALCQRYYEVITSNTGNITLPSSLLTAAFSVATWGYKVTKRAAPTFSLINGATGGNGSEKGLFTL